MKLAPMIATIAFLFLLGLITSDEQSTLMDLGRAVFMGVILSVAFLDRRKPSKFLKRKN